MDQEGSLAAALASARASGSHPAPGLPIKGKMFAPHVPHNKNKKRQRMHGAQPRDSPGVKPNHNLQNDDFNQSNHNSWNNNCNDNPTNPNESQETALITDEAPRKKSKHWNHHISTNSKESREAISSSKRVGDKRSYSWHRKQTVQDTVEEDNAVAEQQIHSNLDTFSRHQDVTSNRMHFKGPSGISYSHVQDHDVQADPDSCYKLWNMLDAAYDARERCVRRKEEELAKREQAVQTQEEIVAHWKAQAQAERLEAAHMRQEAYAEWLRLDQEAKRIENLKADIEKIRGEILTKQTSNDLGNNILENHGAQSSHVKMEFPHSGDHIHENKGDESLEATGNPSQCDADASQVKLDISGKAPEHPTQTVEFCNVSVSEVTSSNVSEKRYLSHEQCHPGVSEEIVNTTFESPVLCVTNMAVMEDLDCIPSEVDQVDDCQDRHRIGDKESTQQLLSQSNTNSKLKPLPPFPSLLPVETLICKETKPHSNNAECSIATPKVSAIPVKVKIEDEIAPSFIPIKDCKSELIDEFNNDELDHVSLEERKKLCKEAHLDRDIDTKWLQADSSQAGESNSGEAWKEKARNFTLKRNNKKTKTCSVETALEEDAPGLLQVLREKGVMEEIKLYGEFINDLLGLVNEEDNFKDLENIIEKLWGRPSGLFKVIRTRQTPNKPTYCLPCLLSLIEQTRSLQNRKWPVEWGWCRQLQSFVFVFERHNRIVLERPEYGFATYFFELVQLLPIKWQVGRLITVMSIATCSRTALLANKPLEIGHDLNEEEASILEDYGWTPNSGLASLLNYCDRVVHDRKEDDDTEWRSKIGKLLMDGHAGGMITKADIPKKLKSVIPIIKLEGCQ